MYTILYVDDEPGLLEIGKLFLERGGQFSVETITSATQALEALHSGHYDAIISDYQMPGMDGIEFLKRVRASGNPIPFIIFTGRGREEIVIQAINEGADFYLQKGGEPVSQFTELAHKVRQAVQQRMAEVSIRDHERREADIINFLPDATFAIDTYGVVIAWNRAMERMTGVSPPKILGKGNYEYALPFYHERRPILIDLVLSDDPETEARYPYIKHEGKTLFSEITIPHFHDGRGAALWFTASPLYDNAGNIIGAIESIREITEWKRAKEARNESERRFRELADMLPQAVFEADANGILMYANRFAFEIFGYPEDEFQKGLNILQMIAPPDRERATAAYRAMVEGEGKRRAADEYHALKKDGRSFPISIYSSPIVVNGRITGIRGIIVDITERKQAENDLQNSVAFLNSLIDQSPTPMWISDEIGTLIRINRACCDLLKITEAEVMGKYSIFDDNIVKEQGFLPLVQDVFHKGVIAQFQLIYDTNRLKAIELGKRVSLVLDVTIFPVRDRRGKITNAVIQHINITDRKRAEERIHESEQNYRLLFENATEGILIAQGDRLVHVNPTVITVLGHQAEEITSRPFTDFIHPDDREMVMSRHLQRMRGEVPPTGYMFRIINGEGQERWIWINSTRMTWSGKSASLSFLTDMTERKLAEDRLIAASNEYTNLLDQIQDIYYRSDAEGRLVRASRSWATLLGYDDISECIGRSIADDFYVNPPDRKRFLEAVCRDGRVTNYEVLLKKKDGTPVLVSTSSHVNTDATGKVLGIEGTFRDVTERKRTEREVQQSRDMFRTFIDHSYDAVIIHDTEGRVLDVNATMLELYRVTREEALTCTIDDLSGPDSNMTAEKSQEDWKQVLSGKDMFFPWQARRPRDGSLFDVEVYLTRVDIGDQSVILANVRDITERKRKDHILRTQLDLGLKLQEKRGLYDTLKTCLLAAIEISGMDAGAIYLVDEMSGSVDLIVSENLGDEFVKSVSHYPGGSANARMVMAGEPIYVQYSKTGIVHTPVQESEGLKAIAIIPITYNKRAIAHMNITSHTVDEIPLSTRVGLETIATQIGVAIERIKADEALLESEQRYRNVVEDQTEFICRFRPDGTHVFVNEAYCRYFGLKRDELLGHRFTPKIPPEDRGIVKRFFASLTPDHPVDTISHRIIMPDGRLCWQKWSDRAIFDSAGNIIEYQSVGRDITETKKAEAALKESEERFRTILDTTSEWIWELGLDGRHTYSNPAVESVLGYNPEEFLKLNAFNLMHPEDRERIEKIFASCVLERKGWRDLVVRWRHKDGTYRYLESNAEPVFNDRGELAGFQGADRDITGRRQAEEALLESEGRYRSLSEASEDLIFVIDKSDRVVYVNNSAATMFGFPVNEIIGRERKDLFPADVSAGQKKAIRKVLETGEGFRSTGRLSFNGRELWFDHSLMPIRDASGNVTQVLGISHDITERKKTEEDLRQKTEDLDSRNRLISTLLDTVPIGIFMVEAPSGKPIIANQEATRLLGRGIFPDTTEKNLAEVYEVYKAGTNTRYPTGEMPVVRGMYGESCHVDDIVVVRPDGTTVQLEVFGTPVTDNHGRIVASLVSLLDITERKRTEQVIKEANKKISLLTSITRHDVVNKVAALRGYASVAMTTSTDPGVTDLLEKIDLAASMIARQIEFTKMYQELSMHTPGWHAIHNIIEQQEAGAITLSCKCNAEVFADPMLERVFYNLIDNAARHGGKVTKVKVRCKAGPDNSLVITVEDNGTGVPPDLKEKIFEKGFGKHTGFGLFLAREILAITGITIRETGLPGKGARFEITVPKGTHRSAPG